MDDTTALHTWLTGQTGVVINDNSSPDSVDFQIAHQNPVTPTRKELMDELMNHDLWLVSCNPVGSGESRVKRYKVVGGASPTRPEPIGDPV